MLFLSSVFRQACHVGDLNGRFPEMVARQWYRENGELIRISSYQGTVNNALNFIILKEKE